MTTIPGTAAIGTAMGGKEGHVMEDDAFSVTLKCHDANGGLYNITITRETVTVSGYEADSILATVET